MQLYNSWRFIQQTKDEIVPLRPSFISHDIYSFQKSNTEVRYKCNQKEKSQIDNTDVFITRNNSTFRITKSSVAQFSSQLIVKTLKLSDLLLQTRPKLSDIAVYSRTCYFPNLSTFVSLCFANHQASCLSIERWLLSSMSLF